MKANRNLFNISLLFLVVLFVGCEDNRMNDMVDDKVYLLNPGLNEQSVFNWPGYTYNLYVIKSGTGSQGGELGLTINEALLTRFNEKNQTDLKMLPQELFNIVDKKIILAQGDYRASFKIELVTEGIALLKTESGYQYALPCEVSVMPGTTLQQGEDEVMYSIIVPEVKEPYIEFEKAGLLNGVTIIDPRSTEKTPFSTEVQINYNNEWDLDFSVEVENSLVTQYNTDHKTDYKMINEAAFKIDPSSLVIPKNTNKSPIIISFLKDGFIDSNGQHLFGNYLMPVRIASVSKNSINPEKSVQFIPVTFSPLLLE